MASDPMEGYDQAEAEADERFYEEREDRHPDEDDGQTYADPRDEREERRLAAEANERRFDVLTGWVLGPRPE